MKKLKALVLMQIRDKLDFSWWKDKKKRIQAIVLSIVKFLVTTIFSAGILFLVQFLNVFAYSEIIDVMIVFFVIMFAFSIISCTFGLLKSLYLADDNKVLTTFPVSGGILFFSKLIVYYFYELRKSLDLLAPVTLAFLITAFNNSIISIAPFFWMWIPMLFIILLPILIASFLSIPALYINRFFKKYSVVEAIVLLILVGLCIYGVVYLINLIPENINLINNWQPIREAIHKFLISFKKYTKPLCYLVYVITGTYRLGSLKYHLDGTSFLSFFILIAVVAVLICLAYLIIKPIFFSMLTKSFEFDKNLIDKEIENKVHKPFISFVNKEFRINFRTVEFSGNYIAIYIIIPVLILLLNNLFAAMSTKLSGVIMTYAFNILLILLPLLASNSIIATLYSKEGRAGYIKKTKPINPFTPLISKLLFNLIFSIPSIVISVAVFTSFSHLNVWLGIMLSIAILLIQYGHIFYSATLDIMNPQNEQYATVGEEISNPNENKSTIMAFVLSFAIALVSYALFNESNAETGSFLLATIKILLISIAIFASSLTMFLLKIKAYYYER